MEQLSISKEYLCELVNFHSTKTVGKLLKRFELIDDKKILKKEVREIIYESYRDLRDLLIAHSLGLNMKVYSFEKPKDE